MKNTVIYLIGFPGVGKYTIAKEIARQEDFRLVDNHLINMPVFSLIRLDGKTKLPDRIWDNVRTIWDAVLDTMIHISPPDFSFVLTNALFEDPEQRAWFNKIEETAATRKALFVPVRILCSVEENEKRIVTPDRTTRLKETNPESPSRNAEKSEVLKIVHPHLLDLDVTALSAEEAAQKILDHARRIAGVPS